MTISQTKYISWRLVKSVSMMSIIDYSYRLSNSRVYIGNYFKSHAASKFLHIILRQYPRCSKWIICTGGPLRVDVNIIMCDLGMGEQESHSCVSLCQNFTTSHFSCFCSICLATIGFLILILASTFPPTGFLPSYKSKLSWITHWVSRGASLT